MMTFARALSTHVEKVQFVLDYLAGKLSDFTPEKPLMIVGQGATGKTYVMNEVREKANVPYCHMGIEHSRVLFECPEDFQLNGFRYPSLIIQSLGIPEDFETAKWCEAQVVQFLPDGSYKN